MSDGWATVTSELVVGILVAIVVALMAVWHQLALHRRQLADAEKAQIAREKKQLIEKLVAYRFVLRDDVIDQDSAREFNAALNAVLIHFADHPNCIEKFLRVGQSEDLRNLYDLVVSLMKAVPIPVTITFEQFEQTRYIR
ncbi:MAG: hypothetical protein MEQ84_07710 [Mesorhizobium sp.]|nr:hypothetical protein [Mesorhizobium sp.]